MNAFSVRKELRSNWDEALVQVPEALKTEGFGVLTEVDVKATLEKKLGVDFRRYKILGACNPPFAHQALQEDLAAGLMMPCNVVLYENDDRKVTVMAVDPTQMSAVTANPRLGVVAQEVKEKLLRALERVH